MGSDDLVEAFDLPAATFDWAPSWNVAPGQRAPVIARDGRGTRMGPLTWGLVPDWRDEPGRGLINARGESVDTKPSFRDAFARRRCLVPADGFYEWGGGAAEGGGGRSRVPWWIHPRAGGLVTFAGLWASWRRPGQEPMHTFAVVTTDANADLREVHDRMPVVIADGDREAWLDPAAGASALRGLLRPAPEGTFARHVVDRRVNSPGENDPDLVRPV